MSGAQSMGILGVCRLEIQGAGLLCHCHPMSVSLHEVPIYLFFLDTCPARLKPLPQRLQLQQQPGMQTSTVFPWGPLWINTEAFVFLGSPSPISVTRSNPSDHSLFSQAFWRADSPIQLRDSYFELWKSEREMCLSQEEYDKPNFSGRSTFKFLKVDCWRGRPTGVKIAYSISLEVGSFLCSGATDFIYKRGCIIHFTLELCF